jgi:Helix-turn-helix domain
MDAQTRVDAKAEAVEGGEVDGEGRGASAVTELDAALAELLRPLVREVVREELEKREQRWRWASVKQAAELLDMTPSAIYHRVGRGQLPHRRVGSKLYIDMQALDHQLDRLP